MFKKKEYNTVEIEVLFIVTTTIQNIFEFQFCSSKLKKKKLISEFLKLFFLFHYNKD